MLRFEVRNEYGLGSPELYNKETAAGDDPKAALQGVAVAGLVGILRQLGDLAEFAAEVFHGLQEQVTTTSSRSHKLMSRVRRIEVALPPLEKAVLAQKSHLHFAYTAGLYWHPQIRCEKNHFIYNDLPRFIMDSYEECRQPPRLHLLDKFDLGGPGSCLKRYSDPTIFMRASGKYTEPPVEKLMKIKKSRKIKKKKPARKNEPSKDAYSETYSDRAYFSSLDIHGKTSPSQSFSARDAASRSNQWDLKNSLHSRNTSGYLDSVPEPNYSALYEEQESKEPSSPVTKHHKYFPDHASFDDNEMISYNSSNILQHNGIGGFFSDKGSSEVENKPAPSYVSSSDENYARVQHTSGACDHDAILGTLPGIVGAESMDKVGDDFEIISPKTIDQFVSEEDCNVEKSENANTVKDMNGKEAVYNERVHHIDFRLDSGYNYPPTSFDDQLWDVDSETENYMDALNTIESESETDLDYQTKREIEQHSVLGKKSIDGDTDRCIVQDSNMHSSNSVSDATNRKFPREELAAAGINDVDSDIHRARHNLDKEASDDDMYVVGPQHSDCYASDLVSVAPDRRFFNKEMFVDETHARVSGTDLAARSNSNGGTISASNSISSDRPVLFQSSEMANGDDFNSQSLPDLNSCGQGQVTSDSVDQQLQSPGRGDNLSEEHIVQNVPTLTTESQKHPKESSTTTSIQFWTNGGLLGLEPSKPPDFSLANPAGHASSATVDKATDAEESKVAQSSDFSTENTSILNDNDEENFTRWKVSRRLPSADLDVRHHHLAGSTFEDCSDISVRSGPKTHMVTPQDRNATYIEDNNQSLSRMFSIGNKLLASRSHRELSLESNDNSDPSTSLDFGNNEEKGHQGVKYRTYSGRFKDYSRNGSPFISPSSSPLLGHMKISFQPVDRFENSELKLKFPNGNDSHESCRDLFPSFQLVPGRVVPLVDINSDSEADTFCRSSPYMSDDCLSRQSDSNSEIWESGESPVSKDHELYDALRRISLTEPISTSLEPNGTTQGEAHNHPDLQISYAENGVGRSQSAHFFDLPSLHDLSPSIKNDSVDQCKEKSLLKSYSLKERNPTPPPLPPIQWRAVKPHLDGVEDNQHPTAVALDYAAYEMEMSESTISQQPKPAPFTQEKIIEDASMLRSKQLTQQTLNLQREAKPTYVSVADGKDDFLHQIRTKSFNLRRTVTTKTAGQPVLPSSVKVTAIIEKANAIRQAVGSDDGDEDDNWSDI